jgi:hypothetical protein
MDFYAVLDQVVALLQQRGRLTYGALKRQFQIDEEYLADLKAELIDGQRVAVDEGGKVLVWVGKGSLASSVQRLESKTVNLPDARHQTLDPRPVSYTPRTWPNAFVPNKRPWKRGGQPMGSARRLRPCLPISKARQR